MAAKIDYFVLNGDLNRGEDLQVIRYLETEQQAKSCVLMLVTNGGNPDAAYKIARHLQQSYDDLTVLISGPCKSAGTLLAVGANVLAFTSYGELGPLDIQLAKTDNLNGLESGLNISEAFLALEGRARDTLTQTVRDIFSVTGGVVSFQTASHAASEVLAALYGPIFARIDPEEVGSRTRAMRIGEDYGKRLNDRWQNLKPNALELLSSSYPSHTFVIDFVEAQSLFSRVRLATSEEITLVNDLGTLACHPRRALTIQKIEIIPPEATTEHHPNDQTAQPAADNASDDGKLNGQNSGGPGPSARASSKHNAAHQQDSGQPGGHA